MTGLKISSVKSLGTRKTYNVTMASEQHNYAINVGRVRVYTKNSHSCCYAYNSYITAFLKANYPEEFLCAYLNVAMDRRELEKVQEVEREAQRMGIKILPRDINNCDLDYRIVKKKDAKLGIVQSEIRPSIHCKSLPVAAARNIVSHRPFASIKDFADRTDYSVVDGSALLALAEAGFFKTRKAKLVEEFTILREDQKKLKKSGKVSQNIFAD